VNVDLHSLVGGLSYFIMTTITGKGSTEVHANLLSETCQNGSLYPCKQANEGQISNMTQVQNPYKLPLNPELTVLIEKPHESANNVVGYQYRFEHNM
jgi:adenylylsulfate kinase-like enzyme